MAFIQPYQEHKQLAKPLVKNPWARQSKYGYVYPNVVLAQTLVRKCYPSFSYFLTFGQVVLFGKLIYKGKTNDFWNEQGLYL